MNQMELGMRNCLLIRYTIVVNGRFDASNRQEQASWLAGCSRLYLYTTITTTTYCQVSPELTLFKES